MASKYGLMAPIIASVLLSFTSRESFRLRLSTSWLGREAMVINDNPPGEEKQVKDAGLALLMWGRLGLLPDKLVRVDFSHRDLSGAVEIFVCDPDCFFP